MSSRRLAIIATYGHKKVASNGTETTSKTTSSSKLQLYGNINVLLGGLILSLLIIFIVMLFYCCHRNIRMNTLQPLWSSYLSNNNDYAVIHRNNITSRIYNVATITDLYCHEYETIINQPPPSYEYVMNLESRKLQITKSSDFRLPTYEETLIIK